MSKVDKDFQRVQSVKKIGFMRDIDLTQFLNKYIILKKELN